MKHKVASWLLLAVAMSWGLAFVTMKDALGRQSVNSFLFYRFSLACIALLIVRPQIIKNLNRDVFKHGVIIGLFYAAGFIFQTYGLDMTGAAITGFITGLYVVATPLFEQLFGGNKLGKVVWISIAIATIGLGLLSLKGFSIGIGELLVFISALCYTGQIIGLSKWSFGRDFWALTFVQLFTISIVTFIAALIEGFQTPPDSGVWAVIVFTAVVCSAVAAVIQTWSQAILDSTKAAVIMTMEVVFAAFFAVTLGGETLSLRTFIGGLLVVTSMYLIVFYESKHAND
jgi:drug/metabolite transporter (DMT)-like permease